jgi:hypothetical protein
VIPVVTERIYADVSPSARRSCLEEFLGPRQQAKALIDGVAVGIVDDAYMTPRSCTSGR